MVPMADWVAPGVLGVGDNPIPGREETPTPLLTTGILATRGDESEVRVGLLICFQVPQPPTFQSALNLKRLSYDRPE